MDDTALIMEMIRYDHGDPKRIHHFLKVYEFAQLIGKNEKIDNTVQHIVETAALVHDIGIHLSEQKYGSSSGIYQEKEGPAEARTMLTKLRYPQDVIERVCYLVGHHHTYTNIDGIDYQILVEADFLVNLYEDCENENSTSMKQAAESAYKNIFRTGTGKQLCRDLYEF